MSWPMRSLTSRPVTAERRPRTLLLADIASMP
jgi:hypothetical protein